MVKYKMAYATVALALVAGGGIMAPLSAWAEGGDEQVAEKCFVLGDSSYETFLEARNAASDGDTISLSCDVEQDKYYGITKDLTFDLNGHTYKGTKDTAGTGAFLVSNNHKFTVADSADGGKISGVHYGVIVFSGGELTLQSGEISSESDSEVAIYNNGGSVTIQGGKVTTPNGTATSSSAISTTDGSVLINDGEVAAGGYGIAVWHDATLTVNGGSIVAERYFAVTGNGTVDSNKAEYGANTVISINGGSIRSINGTAIYHPQKDGIMTISGNAEIYGKKTGVEIRAGNLGISGGSITVDGTTEYNYTANGNGSTTNGVAIAVAQHNTKLPITVTITGGTFTAPVAFSEINPQENSAEDLDKISLSISGGTFIDNDGVEYVVHSEDKTGFITGGTYNKDLDEKYIADGYVSALDFEENAFKVLDPNTLDPADEIDTFIYENGEEVNYIAPKKIDYADDWLEDCSDESGHVCGWVDFGKTLIADRQATLSMVVKDDTSELTLDESKGGELIGAVNIDMLDRDGQKIEVKDNQLTVTIELDKDTYDELSGYDKLYAVYFDENGVEQERIEAELQKESVGEGEDDYWYYLTFETTHLSTYGIVGINETEEATASPDTGTMTREGGSAMSAAIVAAIAVGLIVSATSFAYLIRRK